MAFKNLLENVFDLTHIKYTIKRFPIAIGCLFLLCYLGLASVHGGSFFTNELVLRLSFAALASLAGVTTVYIYAEGHRLSSNFKHGVSFLVVLFYFVLTFLMEGQEFLLGFTTIASCLGFFVLLNIAPYIHRSSSEEAICYFGGHLRQSAAMSFFVALILCGGLSLAFAALDFLFGIPVAAELYADTWIIGSTLFSGLYFYGDMPENYDEYQQKTYRWGTKFIITWLLCPLIIFYFIIIYAYFTKIILIAELPKGFLVWFIAGFGSIGILTHFLAHPIRFESKAVVKFVHKYFYYALLLPIAMMFYAIYVRMVQYGFTEQRYMVVLCALWMLACSIYAISTKSEKLKFMPLSLGIALLLSCMPIIGAYDISLKSQKSRLENLLVHNNILKDGKIAAKIDSTKIKTEDKANIYSILNYMRDTDKLGNLATWFNKDSKFIKNEGLNYRSNYTDLQNILDDIGLKDLNSAGISENDKGVYVDLSPENNVFISYNGKGIFTQITGLYYNENNQTPYKKNITLDDKTTAIVFLDKKLNITINKKHKFIFDLTDLVKKSVKESKKDNYLYIRFKDTPMLTDKKLGYNLKIYITNLSGHLKNEKFMPQNLSFILMIEEE